MIFTGKIIDSAEGVRVGLFNQALAEPLQHAMTLAAAIAKNGPLALRMAKRSINLGQETDLYSPLSDNA